MDYNKYTLTLMEKGKLFLISTGICVVVSWLFYDHWFFVVFIPVFFYFVCKKKTEKKKKERFLELEKQFQNALQSVSSGLSAGYSMENAWKEAHKEMMLLYGRHSYICRELQEINHQISLNVPLEEVVEDLGKRSGIEDIENFAQIFRFAKRGGGNFSKIIHATANHMQEKTEVRQEIEVLVASKKLEQNIMNVVPLGILAYLKISSGDFLSAIYGNAFGVCFMSICLGVYGAALLLAEKILNIEV